tara:strand:- start:152 stop:595 length:444 start_codon:yes stop_codon:yes gene_type:complete
MANVVPFSFAQELLKGTHNFTANTIKLALYTAGSGAPYSTSSTVYDAAVANEVSGAGYTTGGNTLSSPVVANQTNVATLTFAQTQFTSATFGAAYAVIYNNSASDKLVVVLDFGGTKSCSNGTFTITFPSTSSGTPAGTDSLISITS